MPWSMYWQIELLASLAYFYFIRKEGCKKYLYKSWGTCLQKLFEKGKNHVFYKKKFWVAFMMLRLLNVDVLKI